MHSTVTDDEARKPPAQDVTAGGGAAVYPELESVQAALQLAVADDLPGGRPATPVAATRSPCPQL